VSKKLETKGFVEQKLAKVLDYKRTFSSQAGTRVLHDLMHAHYMLGPTFTKTDPNEVAFREGQRNVVLRILTLLDHDPEKLRVLIREATDGTETG
jgi:hypothetical protein